MIRESFKKQTFRRFVIAMGPILALVVYALVPQTYVGPQGGLVELGAAGRGTAAVAAWMALWWLTEVVHLSVTALLPLALFPLMGIRSIDEAAAPYADDLIFLFMGGFILSLAMQRWGFTNGSRCAP